MEEQTNMPTRKVVAGGVAGAAVTLAVWILNTYVPVFTQKPITGEAASLAVTLLSALIAYFTPPAPGETTITLDGSTRTAIKSTRNQPQPINVGG
ncbi:MAG TPA: hypothetical protein PLD20_22760 [Blastocatellia bacterium]|nr:hypothetical protein [Blastocatellia bacterium]HMV83234.1 hypothetical protein [Blastocatellia bacterium]HMX27052.1 hypothetical protein [Blastocatellia bacterium]HMY72237.1 hypothetical protein [Blastocatellia bacterium]HMZ20773.1 hypothetical protein [Blastocatellia bacterium]